MNHKKEQSFPFLHQKKSKDDKWRKEKQEASFHLPPGCSAGADGKKVKDIFNVDNIDIPKRRAGADGMKFKDISNMNNINIPKHRAGAKSEKVEDISCIFW